MIIELKSLANIKRHDFGIFLSYRIKLTAKTVDEDPASCKPPCWTYVTQRHSPDYVSKCGISKRSLSFFYWSLNFLSWRTGNQNTVLWESRYKNPNVFSSILHGIHNSGVYSAWTELCWMELLMEHLKNKHLISFNWFNKDARKFRF